MLTLVDDIPVVAFPLVTPHHRVDVVRHDLDQRRIVKVAVGHPAGQLRVPDEGVAAEVLLVLRRPVDVLVGGAKVELAAVRLGLVPFLGVLGRDGAELALDDVLLLLIVADGQRGADVFAAGCDHGGVESLDLSVEEPESMGLVLGSVWFNRSRARFSDSLHGLGVDGQRAGGDKAAKGQGNGSREPHLAGLFLTDEVGAMNKVQKPIDYTTVMASFHGGQASSYTDTANTPGSA